MTEAGFTKEELLLLSNALNEVLNGPGAVEDFEFSTRLGVSKDVAEKLLEKLKSTK